jgi:hypothetical protein
MKPHKRRRYLIDKELQLRLLIYNIFYFLILLISVGVGLFLPLYFQIEDPTISAEELHKTADMILYMHSRLWPVVVGIFIVMSIHSIFVSHRIAGPLYRFRTIFKQIREGNISKQINIRKRDFLKNEKLTLEEMMMVVGTKIRAIQSEQAVIEDILRGINHKYSDLLDHDLRRELDDLEKHVLGLKRESEYFKVSTETGPEK